MGLTLREPFPTPLVAISHIIVGAINTGETQITVPDELSAPTALNPAEQSVPKVDSLAVRSGSR